VRFLENGRTNCFQTRSPLRLISLLAVIFIPAHATVTKAVTSTVKITEKERIPSAPPPSTKPCTGYVGGLLGATMKDGRPYKSDWGSKCSHRHVSPAEKSEENLLEFADSMSPAARVDLRRAIKGASVKKAPEPFTGE
jgi:hypothetical protein